MKLFNRSTAFVALFLIVSVAAFGQTTAQLVGTVTTGGTPLPGVTITISSPQMQGTRTAVSGDAGGYAFGGLPAGDYTVTFDLAGMQSATKRVHIGPGQVGGADADLKVAGVAEAITVTAAAPSILETPSVSANLSAKLVDQLPVQRTVLQTALLAPGVNGNTPSGNQLSISGSPGYDNLVMVNGVSITENVRHQALTLFIEDAIQETTVLTGAISAEYGGFTGGVVNSITKSGGNQFSGSLRDSATNPSWQEKTPIQKANNTQLIRKNSFVYEGTLGGFVLRDRLWFFGAGRKTKATQQFNLRGVPNGDATKAALDYVRATDEKRYEVKLTGQVTPKHNLTASYLDVASTINQDAFSPAATYDLDSLAPRKDPQKLKSAHYNGVLTNNWMLEGQYSKMNWGVALGSGAPFTDFVRGTLMRNRGDGNARFYSPTFCGVCDKETRSNDGWNVKTNYFISSKSLGNQNIVGGVEKFSEHRFANNYQSGSNFRFFINNVQRINNVIYPTITPGRQGSAAFLRWTPIFVLQQNKSNLGSESAFVNDRWDLNEHVSVNLGVRYDKNDATDSSGNKVSKDSRFTPRLNVTYDIMGNGRHRATASYAQYASRIVEGPGTAAAAGGQPASIDFSYLGPAINPAGTPVDQLLTTAQALAIVENWLKNACNAAGQCGTSNLSLLRPGTVNFVPGYDSRIDKTLKSPYVQEYTIGYGTQLMSNLVTRIDLVSRDWKGFYAFRVDQSTPQVTDPLGIQHDVQIVQNSDNISRKYRGVQFQGNYRPSRFNVGVNYTYSTLKGNDEQESPTSGTVGNTPGNIYYPELNNFPQRQPNGWLAQDERHRLRAWVGYDVPWPHVLGALNISVLENYDSALPYSAVQSIDLSPYANTLLPANSHYVAAPLSGPNYYFSKRGEFRVDAITSTNLSVNYRYPISRAELFAEAQMLNVFDRAGVANPSFINTTVNTANTSGNFAPFNPYTDTPKECPQGTAGATCKAGGYNFQKSATFGQPNNSSAFQTPRTWRFSVGARF